VMGCCALALADLNCSFHGVFLVMAALHGRRRTGRGQHIDLSQTEACASLIGEAFIEQQLGMGMPGPVGNVGPDGETWALIPTEAQDSWVAAATDRRGSGADALDQPGRPSTAALLRKLGELGLETAPVLSPDQVAADERFAQRGFLQHVKHPLPMIGELTLTSLPWHLDGVVAEITEAAPLLGEDNEKFYGERLDAKTYAEYEKNGVFH
jgi:crotonobetainyl-CoA:carnitine CoA-transferase CaiB-like acyl-CoA transferase